LRNGRTIQKTNQGMILGTSAFVYRFEGQKQQVIHLNNLRVRKKFTTKRQSLLSVI
jgi:hypothetical protein